MEPFPSITQSDENARREQLNAADWERRAKKAEQLYSAERDASMRFEAQVDDAQRLLTAEREKLRLAKIMLTSETKNYRYELDDKSSVIEQVNKLLDDPQFNGVNISIGQEWPVGVKEPKKYYSVSVYLKIVQ